MEFLKKMRGIERILVAISSNVVMFFGFRLLESGLAGNISLVVNANKFHLKLLNATPGLIFISLGMGLLFFIIRTPLQIESQSKERKDTLQYIVDNGTQKEFAFVKSKLIKKITNDIKNKKTDLEKECNEILIAVDEIISYLKNSN